MYQIPISHAHRHQVPLLWIAVALLLVQTIFGGAILFLLWGAAR